MGKEISNDNKSNSEKQPGINQRKKRRID